MNDPPRPHPLAYASTDFQSALLPVAPGSVIAGKYKVERVLGEGGMGFVLEATHITLGQKVAIKVMRPEVSRVAEAAARFLREAQAAARIQSEHVARVADVGTLEGSGVPFMVMEFLSGTDLAELVRVRGRLPIEDAVDYVLQACEALGEAHRIGIVHRDLKPANLFLTARPDATPLLKVLDFGISKVSSLTGHVGGSSLTSAESVMGSPRYMSPEQMRSTKSVDARTDLWALGCILYELLAARPAFDAESVVSLAAAIATAPAPRLRAVRPDVPSALEAVVLRCLEKEPAARTGSVADFAVALAPFAPARARISIERVVRLAGGAAAPSLSDSKSTGERGASDPSPRAGSVPVPAAAPPGATAPNFSLTSAGQVPLRGPSGAVVGVVAIGLVLAGVAAIVLFRPAAEVEVPSGIASGGLSPSASASPALSASVAPSPPPSASTPEAGSASVPSASPPKPMPLPPPIPHVVPRPPNPGASNRPPAPRGAESADPNDPALNGQK